MKNSSRFSKKDFGIQAIHSIFSKGAMLLIGWLTSAVLARVLKPEGQGLLAMFLVYPGLVLAFGELGVRQATALFIGQQTYDEQDITSSITGIFAVSVPVALTGIFIGYLYSDLFRNGVFIPICFGFMTFAALFQRYGSGILLGKKRSKNLIMYRYLTKSHY